MEAEEDREVRDISYPFSPVKEDFEYDTGDAWRAAREQRQLDWEELYSQSLLANETATSDEIQAGWLDDSEQHDEEVALWAMNGGGIPNIVDTFNEALCEPCDASASHRFRRSP